MMTTTVAPLPGKQPDDGPSRATGVRPEAERHEREIKRRRVWLFDVSRRDAMLSSSTAYLVSVGLVMILAYFMMRFVALWTIGPMN